MIPCIEKIARPGMKLVFLIAFRPHAVPRAPRYNLLALKYLGDVEEFEKPMFARENISETPSMEEQRLSAEHKVFLALEALHKRGVEIIVDVYTGSLKKVLKNYTRKGNVRFIMQRMGKIPAMMQSVRGAFPIFGSFKQRTSYPVLLLHSPHAV
jgi:hypothetical protein